MSWTWIRLAEKYLRHRLIDGTGYIGRVGVGHGLHDNRMIAAHFDTCHVYRCRRAAGLHCHRSSRGNFDFSIWLWRPPGRVAYSEVVTAVEAYELTTQGGATDFARLIAACEAFGPYCLIGGLAVNCFVEPVYTLDADIVISHSLNAMTPLSQLRIQFTTDDRYQAFLARSVEAEVLGVHARIACLADVTQGKLWAYGDPRRRLSKRKKDELDLIRLAEAYPELKSLYPAELREQLDRE